MDGGAYAPRTMPSVASSLSSDAPFFFACAIALGCAVMFVWALIGAGRANGPDKFETFAYISGVGASSWLIAALVATFLANWRAREVLSR
jgi:hypothetical protein